MFAFPFTLNGIWSWWQVSFRFWTKWNYIWFKIHLVQTSAALHHEGTIWSPSETFWGALWNTALSYWWVKGSLIGAPLYRGTLVSRQQIHFSESVFRCHIIYAHTQKKRVYVFAKEYAYGNLRRPNGLYSFRRALRIPNKCLVLKLDNGKVVSIANEQIHRQTEPPSTALVYRYMYIIFP